MKTFVLFSINHPFTPEGIADAIVDIAETLRLPEPKLLRARAALEVMRENLTLLASEPRIDNDHNNGGK